MNHLPHAPENNIRVISNFFESSRRYLQVKVHRWYCINETGGKLATGLNNTSTTGGKWEQYQTAYTLK
jgi:hypothetical protein